MWVRKSRGEAGILTRRSRLQKKERRVEAARRRLTAERIAELQIPEPHMPAERAGVPGAKPAGQEMGLSGIVGAQPLSADNRKQLIMDALDGAIQISRKKRGTGDGDD